MITTTVLALAILGAPTQAECDRIRETIAFAGPRDVKALHGIAHQIIDNTGNIHACKLPTPDYQVYGIPVYLCTHVPNCYDAPTKRQLQDQLEYWLNWYSDYTGTSWYHTSRVLARVTAIAYSPERMYGRARGLYDRQSKSVIIDADQGLRTLGCILRHELIHHHKYMDTGDTDRTHEAEIWDAVCRRPGW